MRKNMRNQSSFSRNLFYWGVIFIAIVVPFFIPLITTEQILSNNDTMKAKSANDLCARNVLLFRKDSAIFYAVLGLSESKRINYLHGIARALSLKCQIAASFDDDLTLAGDFALQSLNYYEKIADKKGIDTVYHYLFLSAFAASRFDKSIYYCEKFYNAAILENDQDKIYTSLMDMVDVNQQTGNYEKGFFYAQQLYEIAVKSENKQWLVNALWRLGQLYNHIGDFQTALDFYKQARNETNKQIKECLLQENKYTPFQLEFAEVFSNLKLFDSAWYYYRMGKPANQAFNRLYQTSTGECYFMQGKFNAALQNFKIGLAGQLSHHDNNGVMRLMLDMARVYLVTDSTKAAIDFAQRCLDLSLQSNMNQYILDSYKLLSDAYDLLGRVDRSNYYFRKFASIKEVVSITRSEENLPLMITNDGSITSIGREIYRLDNYKKKNFVKISSRHVLYF